MKRSKQIFLGFVVPVFIFVGIIPAIATAQTNAATAVPNAQTCQNYAQNPSSAPLGLTAQYQQTTSGSSCTISFTDPNTGTFGGTQTINYDAQGNPVNQTTTDPMGNQTTGTAKLASTSSCSLWSWSFHDCLLVPAMSWLGSWFLTLGGVLLRLSGALFDILVQYVIIAFGATVTSLNIAGAINTGWSVFRDVANIVIIGLFVFIAICTILGIQQFGAKKLASRVIIVAVLLNFSLLFTKMIIDFSNFTAFQFYKASAQTAGANVTTYDIAATFLKPMGITNVWSDTYTNQAGTGAGQVGGDANSGFAGFFYGLIGGIMLAGIAAVLLYGTFQIASRGIALIFLMVTASIAFASYLLPKFADSDYGWSAWWNSLMNASIFAPLLMIFLFISLQIIQKAGTFGISQPLSQFINNPTGAAAANTNAWQGIFTYIIVAGLLFASFKISNHFASKVGGNLMGGIGGIVGMAATGGIGLASRFGVAPFLRSTVGYGAYKGAESATNTANSQRTEAMALSRGAERATAEAQRMKDDAAKARAKGDIAEALRLERAAADRAATAPGLRSRATRLETEAAKNINFAAGRTKLANRGMNVMDTGTAQAIVKAAGVTGFFTGVRPKNAQGYSGRIEGRAKEAAKIGEKIAPSEDEIEKARSREEKKMQYERFISQERETMFNRALQENGKRAGETSQVQKAILGQFDSMKNASASTGARDTAATNLTNAQNALRSNAGYVADRGVIESEFAKKAQHNADFIVALERISTAASTIGRPLNQQEVAEKAQAQAEITRQYNDGLQQVRDLVKSAVPSTNVSNMSADQLMNSVVHLDTDTKNAVREQLVTIEEQKVDSSRLLSEKMIRKQVESASNPEEVEKIEADVKKEGSTHDSNLDQQAQRIREARERTERAEDADAATRQAKANLENEQRSLLTNNESNVDWRTARGKFNRGVTDLKKLEKDRDDFVKGEEEKFDVATKEMVRDMEKHLKSYLEQSAANSTEVLARLQSRFNPIQKWEIGRQAKSTFLKSRGRDARLRAALKEEQENP